MDDKPVKSIDITGATEGLPSTSPIPRRQKAPANPVESNGVLINGNGAESSNGGPSSKRTASEAIQDGSPLSKRPKTLSNDTNGSNGTDDISNQVDHIVIDDSTNGPIIINDD
jgi:hypothetical protein